MCHKHSLRATALTHTFIYIRMNCLQIEKANDRTKRWYRNAGFKFPALFACMPKLSLVILSSAKSWASVERNTIAHTMNTLGAQWHCVCVHAYARISHCHRVHSNHYLRFVRCMVKWHFPFELSQINLITDENVIGMRNDTRLQCVNAVNKEPKSVLSSTHMKLHKANWLRRKL